MVKFEEFIKKPYEYINDISTDLLEKYLIKLAEEYYNNEGLISDEVYDDLIEYLKQKKPDSIIFNLNDYNDKKSGLFDTVELPYPMMSLDKIKGTNIKTFNNWIKKFNKNYILSDKEDGISCLIYNKNGIIRGYTKSVGGHQGLDITELLKYINVNTKNIFNGYCLRGELIISKENFKKIENDFKNGRNAVSGIIHNKKLNKSVLKLIDFVAYNIVYPRFKQSEQLEKLKEMKMINIVPWIHVDSIDQNFMIQYFKERKEKSKYEIDGIVITSNEKVYDNPKDKNPDYAIAFKNLYEGLIKVSEVVDVIWNVSKFGYIKPKIKIIPVEIEGSTITYCTAHNARYIVDNKINKGTIIKIAKSGGVIPYIVEVIKPSKTPNLPKDLNYKWNETNIDIYIEEENEETIRTQIIKKLTNTMTVLKVKYFSEGYITRLVDDLGITSLLDIINIDLNKMKDLIGENQGIKIYNNLLNALKTCDINHLLLASNCFDKGMGIKRINLIIDNIPNLFSKKWDENELVETITNIKTFNNITALIFVNGYKDFIKWFLELKTKQDKVKIKVNKKNKVKKSDKQIFKDKKILLSGFRDKEIQDFIISNGGSIPSTISKSLNLLIIPNKTTINQKTKKAEELNIKIMTKEEFKRKYKLN